MVRLKWLLSLLVLLLQVVERVHAWLYESLNLQKICELEGAVDGSTQLDWERSYGPVQQEGEVAGGAAEVEAEPEADAGEVTKQGSGADEIYSLLLSGAKLDTGK